MAIKNVDPNQIDDVIIRKRALLYHSGGAPTTYTRLYLYPALIEVAKSRNLNDLLNAYGYFMPIPVSPSSLQYKRSASHNEVYGIVSGGLLQRNLPKLWHLSIETYLPKDILERVFHNWSQDREWSGEYTQQHFVDYINLIMQYKIPLALYDSSSPERIRHNCEYWCIESFDYKMQPHDDIDYTLELIEWREPHVKLSDIEMTEITEPDTQKPKVRRGSGTALMVFGDNDSRAFNRGEVYNPELRVVLLTSTRPLGYAARDDLKLAFEGAFGGDFPSTRIDGTSWNAEVTSVSHTEGSNEYKVNYRLTYPKMMQHLATGQVRQSASDAMASKICEIIYNRLRKAGSEPFQTNPILTFAMGSKGGDLKSTGSLLQKLMSMQDADPALRSGSYESHLGLNAWCEKLEVRENIPRYRIHTRLKVNHTGESQFFWNDYGTLKITLKSDGVWFKKMYVVRPIKGKKGKVVGDVAYDHKQVWLVPEENTIRTSYKEYVRTVLTTHQWDTYYPDFEGEDRVSDPGDTDFNFEMLDTSNLIDRWSLDYTVSNGLAPTETEGAYTSDSSTDPTENPAMMLIPINKAYTQYVKPNRRLSGGNK